MRICLIDAHIFQSTPSSQKVTHCTSYCLLTFFISIHTFLTEGDCNEFFASSRPSLFQSTPSSQKVTRIYPALTPEIKISIHTFLTEGDVELMIRRRLNLYFNPHLPHRR